MSTTVLTQDPELPVRYALGTKVHGTSYQNATEQIIEWAKLEESRSVCVANVQGGAPFAVFARGPAACRQSHGDGPGD